MTQEQGAQARQIFTEANALLDRIIEEETDHGARRLRLLSRQCRGRRCGALHRRHARKRCSTRFHFLRQQANREGNEPCRSLADFIAPKETGLPDHIGAFAVTSGIGLKELCDRFRAENDDYNAIMAEAIADRLAEAFAECLHKRVRDEWGYGRDEEPEQRELIHEKYRGIRPAAGLSGMPGPHREGHALAFARRAGEHRNADYRIVCHVARLERERTLLRPPGIALFQPRQDRPRPGRRLHERKGMSVAEVERWLGPNLNYEPAE